MIRRVVLVFAAMAMSTFAQEPKPPQLTSDEQKLAAEADKLSDEGFQQYQRGQAAEAIVKERDALKIRRKLYPASKYPDGHPKLAESINNLGFLLMAIGSYGKALPHYEESLAMYRELYPASKYPDGHAGLALSINNLGFLLHTMGSYEKALPHYEQAMTMRQKLYPASKYHDGHPDLAISINNLGALMDDMGSYGKALTHKEQAVAMWQKLYPASKYPDGHPDLALGINNLGLLLQRMGSYEKALSYNEQALAMQRRLYPASKYPDGHPDLARSLNNLGFLLHTMGSSEKALSHLEQALVMRQKLYPASKYSDGHADLAQSLNNLGFCVTATGSYGKALPLYEQALAMNRELYPAVKYLDGHPNLASSINNLGFLLHTMGSREKALPHYEQALTMRQKLYPASKYPDGHPDLASSINNLGALLDEMGSYGKALTYKKQGVAMCQKLYPAPKYPDGHPNLALSINNLGFLLHAMGSYEKALLHLEQALAMRQKLGRRMLATASEAEALAFVKAQPLTRDAFLSITTHLPDTAASAYDSVWTSKSAITRVLEQRQATARAAGTEHAAKLDEFKGLRRRIDQLLQDRRLPPAERDNLLTKASDNRDALERELAKALPMLQRAKELDALGAEALMPLLPNHAAVIDFVRYTRFDYDRAKPGKAGESRTPCHAAFVLAKGLPIRRVELGEAKEIDRAIAQWRTAIESRAESPAAAQLRDLVWAKLAPHLPAGTTTLYLAPDGDLARMPWAALPTAEKRVLLEDYAIATVPHGPFLLEAFKYPREDRLVGTSLLVGGVEYNSKTWPNLPGTAIELTALTPLALGSGETLSKTDATPKRLMELLPKARYAHIATHGYFDAETLTAEQQRAKKAMESRAFGDDSRQVAGKNPLAFTGLVLSGGEVVSGLTLVDLPLENLKLVTLSACETGLGEHTGGEGVQGLQRAFHLAGCPNVIASLWKVGDVSTAVLMEEFYARLWNKEKPLSPIEALREAQLTIVRNPDKVVKRHEAMVAELKKQGLSEKEIASRGFKTDLAALPEGGKVADLKRSPTHWWAAFVLSGVGK